MNNTFSFSRFATLLRKHITEEYKQYLILSAGAAGIMLVFMGLTTLSNLNDRYDTNMPEMIFLVGFVFGGTIFAALTYDFFQNPAKGIRFLQLPASQLEKIMVMFIVTQVVFFIVFLLLFYICNGLMCSIYNTFHVLPKHIPAERLAYYHADLYDMSSLYARLSIALFFVFSAIAHFGSLIFRKLAFIKTAIGIIAVGFAILFFNQLYMKSLIPEEVMPGGLFYTNSLRVGANDMVKGFVLLPATWESVMNYALPGILYISFWLASYQKLKEKQL
jgi:uncharacterized membrane protein YidH (DUF202 family)